MAKLRKEMIICVQCDLNDQAALLSTLTPLVVSSVTYRQSQNDL